MYIGVSAEQSVTFTLTPTDIVAIVVAALLVLNAAVRIARGSPNRGLLRANIAMVITVICSISVVYQLLDPILGEKSYLNAFTHVLMVYVGWEITSSTASFITSYDDLPDRNLLVNAWVPVVGVIATIGTFLALDPSSSRGLEDYGYHPLFVAYWIATVLPLLVGALHLVPRMWRSARLAASLPPASKLSLALLAGSFCGVWATILMFALTAMNPALLVLREAVVSLTLLLFTVAFTTASAALPQAAERPRRRVRPRPTRRAPQ